MGTPRRARGLAVVVAFVTTTLAAVAPAWADNMPPAPPATSPHSPSPTPPPVIRTPNTSPPRVVVIPGSPNTQTRTPSGGAQPQVPAEDFIDPSVTEAPAQDFVDPSAGPQIAVSGEPVPAGPAPTAPAASDTDSSSPLVPISAALALAGGLGLLAAGLRRRPTPCDQAMSQVATRCNELKDAILQMRLAESRLEIAEAQLRQALTAPAYAPYYRRERHHARDELLRARSRLDVEQRLYDEVQAAVQARCGVCPPCVPSATATSTPVATPA